MNKKEIITEETVSPPIAMMVELNTEHLASVEYMLRNCVRSESTTLVQHTKMIRYAQDILKISSDVFFNNCQTGEQV
jgi:hypothetical protein